MRIVGLTAFVVALLLVMEPRDVRAQTCDAPQVLVVLDQSSSMGARAPLPDGSHKWDAAYTALTELTSDYESSIDFGLMLFPSAGECTPGVVNVNVGPNNADEIVAALPDDVPYGGNWTPMADSLYAAADYAPLRDASRRSFVALITDGWEWCDPYDDATRFNPVRATETLTSRGITTFVIGFGGGVDAWALNEASQAAGTTRPGCDPTSRDASRDDNCYYQVDDYDELSAALEEIASEITEEVCDGLDNDCDGLIDEDITRPCATSCGAGVETCVDGSWTDCSAPEAETEECDGVDNDCDGIVDEGCDCVDGDTRPCGFDTGECEAGEQTCTDGSWGPCEGQVNPEEEVCDGLDNDCDGVIDPGCGCEDGDTRPCGRDEGICDQGTQTCRDGVWSACEGETLPEDEVCDGVDNDCDGIVDEGCNCIDGETRPCGLDEGMCRPGEQLCVDGRWGDCDGMIGPEEEICDGFDNDCDGLADDGAECPEDGDICVEGDCVPSDGPPPGSPCQDVVCDEGQECLDGTCVDVGGYEPVPDDDVDDTPVNPGDGINNGGLGSSGCDCQVAAPSRSRAAALWLLAAAGLAWLLRRR